MITAIESAIVAAIKAATLPYTLATVASYGGELDGDADAVIRSFPAVWVSFAGSAKPERTGGRTWRVPCTFVIYCGVRSPRSEQDTRQGLTVNGTVVEAGVYQILSDMRALLLDGDLGLAISPFAPGAVRTLYNTRHRGEALAVFTQEFHTTYALHKDAPAATPSGMLDTVGLTYKAEPTDKTLATDTILTL